MIPAICAAPSVLGELGLLKGRTATCYPGYEDRLHGVSYTLQGVITDGNITTGRGLGYALDLGLELVRLLQGTQQSAKIKKSIQYALPYIPPIVSRIAFIAWVKGMNG